MRAGRFFLGTSMKATLEFTLPEENEEYEIAANASKMYCALSDFKAYLRNKCKYEEGTTLAKEDVYSDFLEMLRDRDINFLIP